MTRRLWLSLALGLCLMVTTCPTWATPYYIAPGGNDSNPGTGPGVAWQTFHFAVSRLAPGDTLFLLDGTYTTANAGGTVTGSTDVLSVSCESGGNAVSGSPGNPITIKAMNERKAQLLGSGKTVAYFWKCSWWNIEGLYLRNVDVNPGGGWEGNLLSIDLSDHFVVKRNLAYFTNTWFNSHGIALYNTHNTLVEENEVLAAGRHGIIQGHNTTSDTPQNNIIRRNYVNGLKHDTMAGGFNCPGSCENNTMDEGISLYPGENAIIENNIVEDAYTGFSVHGIKDAFNNKYFGNVLGIEAGNGPFAIIGMGARDEGGFHGSPRQMPTDIYFEHNVSYRGTYIGCGACKRLTFKNMTIMNSADFLSIGTEGGGVGDGHTSVTGQNILFMNGANRTYDIAVETLSFDYLRNFNNVNSSFPAGATHTSTNDPNMGTCIVYIPDGSNLKGAGLGGADLGANILYRYQDGVLTGVPLWDTGTGRFPCGVQVDGVNNIAGSSCFDVHTRLNVNSGGCPFPTGYGGTTVVNSLIARWQLDEGTGTTMADATGLGHTGTANGGMWQAGKVGPRSVLLDGLTQRVTVASTSDLQLTTSLTLAAWIKPVSSGGGAHGRIINKHGASSNTVGYSFHLADTSLTFAINAVSGTEGLDDATTPSGTVTLGLWQHVAVTLEAGTVRFYRNGQLVSSSTLSGTALASPVPLVLGGADGRTDRGFDGSLDDLRVYNFALSGADILTLYRLTAGQPRHRLVLR